MVSPRRVLTKAQRHGENILLLVTPCLCERLLPRRRVPDTQRVKDREQGRNAAAQTGNIDAGVSLRGPTTDRATTMPFIPPPQTLDLKPVLERRVNRDFSDATDDSFGDLLSRFRGGARFARGRLRGQVVYQYAHDEDWSAARNAATWRSDLLLASVEGPVGPGTAIIGRQRLSFGSERLLGVADWNNVSNAWRAVGSRRGVSTSSRSAAPSCRRRTRRPRSSAAPSPSGRSRASRSSSTTPGTRRSTRRP